MKSLPASREVVVIRGWRAAMSVLTFGLCLVPGVAYSEAGARLRVAVLELRNEAQLRTSDMGFLGNLARNGMRQGLPENEFVIMTDESVMALMPSGETLSPCTLQCEVEVGRAIGADYIVTGEVRKYGTAFRLNLKAYACRSGAFLGSEPLRGAQVADLEASFLEPCRALCLRILTHARRTEEFLPWSSSPPSTPTSQVPPSSAGGALSGGLKAWVPPVTKKSLVKFSSDPPGATVVVNGSVLCPTTPCSKVVPVGLMQVEMQRPRYSPRTEAIEVPASGSPIAVDLALVPLFGWLTVNTEPESLAIRINGESAIGNIVHRREVDPGTFEVQLADPRYLGKTERVFVESGAERVVTLSSAPRQGAIEVIASDANDNDVVGHVRVDGKEVGDAPGTFELLVGEHQVEVYEGDRIWTGRVTVREKQVTPLRATLAPRIPPALPSNLDASQLTAIPGVGIGSLRLGISTPEDVIGIYSDDCRIGRDAQNRIVLLDYDYDRQGAYKPERHRECPEEFRFENGVLSLFIVGVYTDLVRTPEGISQKSLFADVVKAYGRDFVVRDPGSEVDREKGSVLAKYWYARLGLEVWAYHPRYQASYARPDAVTSLRFHWVKR